jgi:dimethylhistidine N-methyltransferase
MAGRRYPRAMPVEPGAWSNRTLAGAADAPRQPRLIQMPAPPPTEVRTLLQQHLATPTAAIPPRFFYDELGSRLFAAITALDEYYPTRTEAALLARHLAAIHAATGLHESTFVDLGAGNCEKAARLFGTVQPRTYVAVDIAADFLAASLDCLQRQFPHLQLLGVGTDFSSRLQLPAEVPAERRLFFYPGSSIGNFTPDEAVGWLRSVRAEMHGPSALWIGVDLQKDKAVLDAAYDDQLGVTAAFNRNVLRHVNRLAGTDFALADWRHVAFYTPERQRIEMHLEACREVLVTWPGGQRRFTAGERIHTENSYKHTIEGFRRLLAAAGLRPVGHWTDERQWFGFFAAVPEGA